MTNKTSSALAFLVGASVGALLGILFAPDKGSNTREKLSYLLDKYRTELNEIVNNLIDHEDIPESKAKEKGKKVIYFEASFMVSILFLQHRFWLPVRVHSQRNNIIPKRSYRWKK